MRPYKSAGQKLNLTVSFKMLWFFVLALVLLVDGIRFDYKGYKLYEFKLANKKLCQMLRTFEKEADFDFWHGVNCIGKKTVVMVAPLQQQEFERVLKMYNVHFNVTIDNMRKMIDEEQKWLHKMRKAHLGNVTFDAYYRYDEIQAYLVNLASKYPKMVKLQQIGKSVEGRELVVAKIAEGGAGKKPGLFIDAGIHAREWIAPASAIYIISQLVENPQNRQLLKGVDWYILPVVNPDGYEFTHTQERLWRKNRQPNTGCVGTDPNRNFDYQFGQQGTSDNPCSEVYPGKHAFSTPEASAVRDFLMANKGKIMLYLTLHSYSEVILVPWAADGTEPEDDKELRALAAKARDAMKEVAGTEYEVGTPEEVLGYSGSGGSYDWAKAVGGIAHSYCFELSPQGDSNDGFILPPSEIKPVAMTAFAGVKVFHKHVESLS